MRGARAFATLVALLALSTAEAADVPIQIERVMRPLNAGGQVPTEMVAGQAFVKFAPGVDRQIAAGAVGATVIRGYGTGWTLVSLPAGMSVASAIDQFSRMPGVSQADGNHVYHPTVMPNDPGVGSQYGLSHINAFSAWDTETGATNDVTIAMVDAGIDTKIPDFSGTKLGTATVSHQYFAPSGAAGVNDPLDPPVACDHGTHSSSLAAAVGNNSNGIAGVAWNTKVHLISLRVFNSATCTSTCGNVGLGCTTSDAAIINAVDYATTTLRVTAGLGKIVINMSLGGTGACSAALQSHLNAAVGWGMPVVISAGNDGSAVNEPANCATSTPGTGIIPVGASDSSDTIATFSSRGPELSANGLIAPGVSVLFDDTSTALGGTGGTTTGSGTSFSAPHVSGVAALMLSANNTLTAIQVQSMLRSSASNVGIATLGTSSGSGLLNARDAVKLATGGSIHTEPDAYAYPNPFRPDHDSQVTFKLPAGVAGTTRTIRLYTIAGQLVRSVSALTWDGKNDAGKLVASGVYLFSISLGDTVLNGRVAVIR